MRIAGPVSFDVRCIPHKSLDRSTLALWAEKRKSGAERGAGNVNQSPIR
jgi:hypothetical protein